jgi:hypothetical protein
MMSVKISDAVWTAIAERGKFGETVDDVLRRVFALPAGDQAEHLQVPVGPRGRGKTRYAEKSLRAQWRNGRLYVNIESVPEKAWDLPHHARTDKGAIRRVRSAATEFGSQNGATPGQIAAIQKALTEAGFYLTGPRTGTRRRPPDLSALD